MNPIGELQAIRERAEKATPGPWSRVKSILCTWWTIGKIVNHIAKPSENEADWDFIEHARADIPALLAKIDRLEKEKCDQAQQMFEDMAALNLEKQNEIDRLQIENERQRQRLQKAGQLIYRAIPAPGDLDEMEKWYRDRDEFLQESKP